MTNDIQPNSEPSAGGSSKPNVVGSTVILGDCVEVMKGFSDNQFDLAVVDPPYGIEINMNMGRRAGKRKMHTDKEWDSEIPSEAYFSQLRRVSRNQVIWGGNYFTSHLEATGAWIFWDKGVPDGVDFADGELAWTSFGWALKKANVKYTGFQGMDDGGKIHPTQKPIKLYDWIFKNIAASGQTILDTHLGSGSSRIAADKAGLDFTGIEIDKEYFDLSEKRWKQYKSQLRIEGW